MALGDFITTDEPNRLEDDPDIPRRGKKVTTKRAVASSSSKPKKIKRDKQVSLLVSENEKNYIDALSYDKEESSTKIIRKFLYDKGFFDD